jgi:hypothetical protein
MLFLSVDVLVDGAILFFLQRNPLQWVDGKFLQRVFYIFIGTVVSAGGDTLAEEGQHRGLVVNE